MKAEVARLGAAAVGSSSRVGVQAANRASSGAATKRPARTRLQRTMAAGASSAARTMAAVTRYSGALPCAAKIPNSTAS